MDSIFREMHAWYPLSVMYFTRQGTIVWNTFTVESCLTSVITHCWWNAHNPATAFGVTYVPRHLIYILVAFSPYQSPSSLTCLNRYSRFPSILLCRRLWNGTDKIVTCFSIVSCSLCYVPHLIYQYPNSQGLHVQWTWAEYQHRWLAWQNTSTGDCTYKPGKQ